MIAIMILEKKTENNFLFYYRNEQKIFREKIEK